jgi:peptidoglycan/LPS O-acetylase OafA/YrhL
VTKPPVPTSPEAPPAHVGRAQRFPLFDSLRAIAALAIVLYHVGSELRPGGVLQESLLRANVGVALFFVISGFLLYRPYVRARIEGGREPGVGSYAWRRFLRIVPAFWVALTVIALWRGRDDVFSADGVLYYGFGQIYRPDTTLGGISQAWTLGVEIAFYAFLPVWALLMTKLPAATRRHRIVNEWIALAALFAFSILWKQLWVIDHDRSSGFVEQVRWTKAALPRFLDEFALGMGLAVLSVVLAGRALPAGMRWLDRRPGFAWAAAAAVFVIAVTSVEADELSREQTPGDIMGRHLLFAAIAFLIVLPAVFGDQSRGLVRKVLANRYLLWIGAVS